MNNALSTLVLYQLTKNDLIIFFQNNTQYLSIPHHTTTQI